MSKFGWRFWEFVSYFVCGFCMGVVDVVFGVFGGIVVLIFGIYCCLIYVIIEVDFEFVKFVVWGRVCDVWYKVDGNLILFFGVGIVSGIVLILFMVYCLFFMDVI